MIYIIHEKDTDTPVVGNPAGFRKNRRSTKRQPKAYTSERNARIAISNMYGHGVIVPYVPLADFLEMARIAKSAFTGGSAEPYDVTALLKRHGYAFDDDGNIVEVSV